MTPKIVIYLRNGMVEDVQSNQEGMDYVVLDSDTEGATPEDLRTVSGNKYYVSMDSANCDPKFVQSTHKRVEKII